MLVIKTRYCLPFHRVAIITCLIAVTFGINLLVGLVSQNSFAQDIMDTNGDGVVDEQDTATTEAVPGDTNGDGVVDELDAETTTEATDAGTDAETATNTSSTEAVPGDTNGDGVVDEQDTATTEAVPGDTNGDGVVDEQDTATTEAVPGDTNGDGVVDEQDTIAGDTNGDGVVDASDAATTTDATNASSTDEIQMDTNGDGVVDELDTQTPTGTDTNGDGVVDASDAATTTDATNASSTDEIQMDTNGDGVVDELDETTATDATNASSTDEIQMDTNGDGVVDELDETTATDATNASSTDEIQMDTNGDGVVDELDETTATDATNASSTDEIQMDTNGDGVVDELDETTATDATNASSTDEIQMDTNGDGVVDELDETTATDATNASSTDEIQMDTNGDGVVDDQDTGTTTAEKQPTATDLEDLTDPDQKQPSAQKAPTTAPAPTQPTTAPAPTQPTTAPAPTQPTTAPAPTQPTTAPAQKAPTATKVDTKDQLSKEKIICNPAEQLLVKDSSGNAVRVLQTILTQMGYDPKTIDGKFGPNTEKAVIQFQEKNGLVKDGKVGKNTWTKLCALYKQTKTTTLEDLIGGGDKAGGGVVPVRENEVCKITKLDLKSGDIGDDIVILQKNLKELGYYPYGVDLTVKKFGPQTEMSVRLFQISNKVPVTGIVDKITHEKICAASTDKNKNRQLILNNFVKNPNASTLDLLKGGQGFKQFKWHAADYLGNPVGPNEKETLKLVNQLNNIILEDRVNRQANAILIDSEYQKDKTG